MTFVVMVLFLLAGAAVQTLVPSPAVLGQARVPVLLCIVLYYALTHEMHVTLAAGLLAGFIQDALSPVPLGYSVWCFWIAGALVSRFRRVVLSESPAAQMFFGGVVGALTAMLFGVLLSVTGQVRWPVVRVLVKVAGSGILGALCAPPVFGLGGWLDRLVGNIQARESMDEPQGLGY